MRAERNRMALVLAGAGLLAGCQVTPPARADLPAGYEAAWAALDRVMAARVAVEERDAKAGLVTGVTAPERSTVAAPGLRGRLLGVQAPQTLRRRVVAQLRPTDGTCQLTVAAWVQRYDTGAAATLAGLDRDPADVATYGPEGPTGAAPTWVGLRRDPDLERALLQAVAIRLK